MTRASPIAAPIGILCAMPQEQALLMAALDGAAPIGGDGLEAHAGSLDGRAVVVATAGVGKVNAAITATLLVERCECRALILSGVAGGLSERLAIGDLVIADRVIDIDYGRITESGRIVYQPGTLPMPGESPDPGYRLPSRLAARVEARLHDRRLHASLGTIVTGDAFLASAPVRDTLANEWDALAVEMEGAAVCGVAERLGLPWLVVRALSDRAAEDSVADFGAFLESTAAACARLVRELLPVLDP